MFMVTRFTEKIDRNLALMNFDWEPCQLVPMWLMTLRQWWRVKNEEQKPNPMDFCSGALSVGPDVVNNFLF